MTTDNESNCQKVKYIKQFSKLLEEIAHEKEERLAVTEIDARAIEEDGAFDQLWECGDYIEFISHWQNYASDKLEVQIKEYMDIIERPIDIKKPHIHYNEGRGLIKSIMHQLFKIYQRLIKIDDKKEASVELALSWLMRCFYYLGSNYERTGEQNESVCRFIIYLNLWMSFEPQMRWGQTDSERFLAWPSYNCAFLELVYVLNSLGIAACDKFNYWGGIGFFMRSQAVMNKISSSSDEQLRDLTIQTNYYLAQAYTGVGTPQLGFRYCAETIRLQRRRLLDQICQLKDQTSNNKTSNNKTSNNKTSEANNKSSEANNKTSAANNKTLTSSPVSPMIEDTRQWLNSVSSASDFFLNRQCYLSTEYLLHTARLLLTRVRCHGTWTLAEERELSELDSRIDRDLAEYLVHRMRNSTQLILDPIDTLDVLQDRIDEFSMKPEIEIGTVDTENEENQKIRFSIDQTKLPPEQLQSINPDEDLNWIFPINLHYCRVLPEFVDIPKEENEKRWKELREKWMITTHKSSMIEWLNSIDDHKNPSFHLSIKEGEIGFQLSETLEFETGHEDQQKSFDISLLLNFPILSCEYELDEGKLQRVLNQSLRGSRINSEVVSPFLCLTQAGLAQLLRFANHYINSAFKFYKLDGWVTDHVQLSLLQSSAYKHLSLLESDVKTREVILKRRLKILSPLIEVLNPDHYVRFITQMSFECGEICQELLRLKMEKFNISAGPEPWDTHLHLPDNHVRSLHNLRKQGIQFYSIHLKSLEKQFKPPLSESLPQQHWSAYFAAQFARMQLLVLTHRFICKFDSPNQSMIDELCDALKIAKDIQEKGVHWGNGTLQPACGVHEYNVADSILSALPEDIDLLRAMLNTR